MWIGDFETVDPIFWGGVKVQEWRFTGDFYEIGKGVFTSQLKHAIDVLKVRKINMYIEVHYENKKLLNVCTMNALK